MLALNDYKKATDKFHSYLQEHIYSLLEEISKIDSNMGFKKMHSDLESTKEPSKFLEYFEELSKVSESVAEDLKVIQFFKEHDALDAEQVNDAMDAILADPDFVKAATNINDSITKEKLKEEIEKCRSIVNGEVYDYQFFLTMLRGSSLTPEEIEDVLTYDAAESTKLGKEKTEEPEEKKPNEFEQTNVFQFIEENIKPHVEEAIERTQLPDLNQKPVNPELEDAKKKFDTIKADVNAFIDSYYNLIEGKSSSQIDFYKRAANLYTLEGIQESFVETEEALIIVLFQLMDLRDQTELSLKVEPFSLDGFTECYDELGDLYDAALKMGIDHDASEEESLPHETDVYFLLDDKRNPSFAYENLDEAAKAELSSLIQELENGTYDYQRGIKHSKVLQNERKGLNAFVNKKNNYAISFLRVRTDEEEKDKTLVLNFAKTLDIFASTIYTMKNSTLLDATVYGIQSQDGFFLNAQKDFRDKLNALLGERGETL